MNDTEDLKRRLNDVVDQWAKAQPTATVTFSDQTVTPTSEAEKIKREDGKRAVRTKSTGDRVYLIDDNAKTKAWITSPEIMTKLGFEMSDVEDLEDSELVAYQMSPSIYRVDE